MAQTAPPTCADVLAGERLGDPAHAQVRSTVLPAIADAPRQARLFAWSSPLPLDTDSMATLALLSSELVTNVVLHVRTDSTYGIAVTSELVLVAVGDDSDRLPQLPAQAGSGRGLGLVTELADRCGVFPGRTGGKAVWFTIARRTGG